MGRIIGKNLSLKIDADEWNGDVGSYTVESAGRDSETFAEATAGVSDDYSLKVTVMQDLTTGSAYRYLWDNAGTAGVAVVIAPYGNSTATADKPHFTFSVNIPAALPTLGGGQGTDGKSFTADIECPFVDGTIPVLVTS